MPSQLKKKTSASDNATQTKGYSARLFER